MKRDSDIQALAENGAVDALKDRIAPALSNPEYRPQAIALLAQAYFAKGNVQLAHYLFKEARAAGADGVEQDAAECADRVAEAGFEEDFTDAGHDQCENCRLRYRAEFPDCPYCSVTTDTAPPSPEQIAEEKRDETDTEVDSWDESALDRLHNLGHEAAERFRTVAASRTVRELAERTRDLGREAGDKIQDLASREDVRRAGDQAKQVSRKAESGVKRALDSEPAREIQESTSDSFRRLSKHAKEFVKEERERYDAAPENRRRIIAVTWVLVFVVLLIGLRILIWIF